MHYYGSKISIFTVWDIFDDFRQLWYWAPIKSGPFLGKHAYIHIISRVYNNSKVVCSWMEKIDEEKGRFHATSRPQCLGCCRKKGALWLATGRNLFWYRAPALIHSQPSRQDCAFEEFKRVIFHENHLFMVATQPQEEKTLSNWPSSPFLRSKLQCYSTNYQ